MFFFPILLRPHFPVYINSVIMWGFIWLIKAPSFWAISQRTWIKLPYLCTEAVVGSDRPAPLLVHCGGGRRNHWHVMAFHGKLYLNWINNVSWVQSIYWLTVVHRWSSAHFGPTYQFFRLKMLWINWVIPLHIYIYICRSYNTVNTVKYVHCFVQVTQPIFISRKPSKSMTYQTVAFGQLIYNQSASLNRLHFVCIDNQVIHFRWSHCLPVQEQY